MLGVEKGLEKASKIMMPLLFIFLLIIVAKSLTLDGALEGARYILQPRLHDISMQGILFALGQSFLYFISRYNWYDYLRELCP